MSQQATGPGARGPGVAAGRTLTAAGSAAAMTPGQFIAAAEAAGLDAWLENHGGPGSLPVLTGELPDGRGWICTDETGGTGAAGESGDAPLPARLLLFAYESAAENAPRWPEGEGLEFNDPVAMLECTAAGAVQALQEAAGGDWSAFAPALAGYPSVPPCTSPPPARWARAASGEPRFSRPVREYLRRARYLDIWPEAAPWRTPRCPECGQEPHGDGLAASGPAGLAHVVLGGSVVLGCRGFMVISPAALGLAAGSWQDWRPDLRDCGPGH